MSDDYSPSQPPQFPVDEPENLKKKSPRNGAKTWGWIWDNLLRLGLGETSLRLGTGFVSIVLVLLVIWVMDSFYLKGVLPGLNQNAAVAAPLPTPTSPLDLAPMNLPPLGGAFDGGVIRLSQMHTNLPAVPRYEIEIYEVQKGDTVFGIAQEFNLKPQTILWANYFTLIDDPHRLKPGQKLNILPVNGVYYQWNAGDGLNGVAKFFGVKPEDIVSWPGNHLTMESVGDFAHPNIPAGTWLVVPNGFREFVTWSAPRITRANPSVAKIMGPGFCGQVADGPIGTNTFIWPTIEHYLSGFDYSPDTNHRGLDFAGSSGNAIYAVDNGVVVYAGWNDFGYGNVVVVDHGDGWQSLYAHLSAYNVQCGSAVGQGDVIGAMGSTGNSSGPHLHFELMSDEYGKVNPWNFLK